MSSATSLTLPLPRNARSLAAPGCCSRRCVAPTACRLRRAARCWGHAAQCPPLAAAAAATPRLRRALARAAPAPRRAARKGAPDPAPDPGAAAADEAAAEEEEGAPLPFAVPDPRDFPVLDDFVSLTEEDAEGYSEAQRVSRPYFGRVEDFHDSFAGVSYDAQDESQMVFIQGSLSPPGFDPSQPSLDAPPGGWPLLLLLPAEGSAQLVEGPMAALEALSGLEYPVRANSHVVQLSFPPYPPSWAADGPCCKNESYLLNVVLPHLRRTLGATGPVSLLGFAHGGWGAVSLLLRHADVFHKAASWDAPLLPLLPDSRLPGMCETFFENRHYEPYVILDLAEDDHVAAQLGSAAAVEALRASNSPVPPSATADSCSAAEASPRLALLCGVDEANAEDATFLSRVLMSAGVPHVLEGPSRALRCARAWKTSWLAVALDFLVDGRGRTGAEAYQQELQAQAAQMAREQAAADAADAAAARAAAASEEGDHGKERPAAAFSSGELGHDPLFDNSLDMDEDDEVAAADEHAMGASAAWSASSDDEEEAALGGLQQR